jgi:hypothetical protein
VGRYCEHRVKSEEWKTLGGGWRCWVCHRGVEMQGASCSGARGRGAKDISTRGGGVRATCRMRTQKAEKAHKQHKMRKRANAN